MLHLLKIDEIKHTDIDGTILWEQKDVNNTFHLDGQQYLLGVAFNTENYTIPSNYYLGLDNRSIPSLTDTLSSLSAEPTQNGYLRQGISSANGFNVSLSESEGNYRALSSIVTFTATGGAWGPVKNLFLATSSTNTGYLISTSILDSSRTLLDGQTVTMRVSVGLTNC